jgi:DNA adenine methylase
MKTTALAPWFGSNRLLAENVGRALDGCSWVGVPFAGGMCELAHIKAPTLAVNDLHKHVINLARVVAHPRLGPALIRRLRRVQFHPDNLSAAQERCRDFWDRSPPKIEHESGILDWAEDYHVCVWMARNGTAGTDGEFKAGMSIRWKPGGGDSAVRFRSATESLRSWMKVLRKATFTTLDVFDFLDKCKDEDGHGLYCDPPFPGPGDAYKHTFTEADHWRLSERLSVIERCRVVCRFYDVPLVRKFYPESVWVWNYFVGRKQTNDAAPEVLLTRNR